MGLNLLDMFDCNVGLTTKRALVKVSENVAEDEPQSQTQFDMTNIKNKTVEV